MAITAPRGINLISKSTTGAPSTGTWAVGDLMQDSAGELYRCTAAGTPGTWVWMGSATARLVDATSNAGQNVSSWTEDIDFEDEVLDVGGVWDGSGFTAPAYGVYLVSWCVGSNNPPESQTVMSYMNGSRKRTVGGGAGYTNHIAGSFVVYLEANVRLSLRVMASVTRSTEARDNWITIMRLV